MTAKLRNISFDTRFFHFASTDREVVLLPFKEVDVEETEYNEEHIKQELDAQKPKLVLIMD